MGEAYALDLRQENEKETILLEFKVIETKEHENEALESKEERLVEDINESKQVPQDAHFSDSNRVDSFDSKSDKLLITVVLRSTS